MYLREDKLTVKVGGLTMLSHATTKPAFILDEDAITGWYDGVSTRRDITQRAMAWGDFPEKAYKGSRVITLTGTAIANYTQELHAMRDTFMATLQHGEFEEISVSNLSGIRYSMMSLEGPTAWLQKSDTVAVWKMELYTDDPRTYGARITTTITDSSITGGIDYPIDYQLDYGMVTQTAGTAPISNRGSTDSYPVFTIRGDFYGGFTISNGSDKTVVYTGIVTMTAPIVIDMAKGTATQDGVDRSSYFSQRDFFSIPPLQSIHPTFKPLSAGTGWCDIMYRDTWI